MFPSTKTHRSEWDENDSFLRALDPLLKVSWQRLSRLAVEPAHVGRVGINREGALPQHVVVEKREVYVKHQLAEREEERENSKNTIWEKGTTYSLNVTLPVRNFSHETTLWESVENDAIPIYFFFFQLTTVCGPKPCIRLWIALEDGNFNENILSLDIV